MMKKESGSDYEKNHDEDEVFFEDAFELAGHGRFNYLVLLTCGLILLNVSMESVGMSYVVTAAECDLDLSSEHKGLVTASAFIGIISTSFLWGYLGDRLGRRSVMLPAMVASAIFSVASSFSTNVWMLLVLRILTGCLYWISISFLWGYLGDRLGRHSVMLPAMVASAIFSVASSFSTNVWMLLVLRILTGCLVSASSATVYAYLGEMHMNTRRASAIAWGSVFISFSFITLPGLAWIIIPNKWSFTIGSLTVVPWRAFIWSWCAPGLAAALLLLFLPESPRFLLASKGPEAALPVLAQMYSWNIGASPYSFPVKKIVSGSVEANKAQGFAGALKNFSQLFRPPLLRCVIISHVSMFAVFMLSSGLYMWVPDILNNILKSTSEESITICTVIQEKIIKQRNMTLYSVQQVCSSEVSVGVFPISMAMGAVFALTYLAIGVFISKVGKKTLYCGIMIVCGIMTVAAAFVPQGGAATALLIIALCSGCSASILAAIAVDVFPTSLRAMAMCVMYMVGRTGAAFGSYILGATLNTHCLAAFSVFGAFTAGTTLLMVFWPKPEEVRQKMEERGLTY